MPRGRSARNAEAHSASRAHDLSWGVTSHRGQQCVPARQANGPPPRNALLDYTLSTVLRRNAWMARRLLWMMARRSPYREEADGLPTGTP